MYALDDVEPFPADLPAIHFLTTDLWRLLNTFIEPGSISRFVCASQSMNQLVWGSLTERLLIQGIKINSEKLTDYAHKAEKVTHIKFDSLANPRTLSLAPLRYIKTLTSLEIRHCALRISEYSALRFLDLQALKLAGSPILTRKIDTYDFTDHALSHVSGLTNLTSLSLSENRAMTDGGFYYLRNLTQLRTLYMENFPQIVGSGFAYLSNLMNLTDIHISGMSLAVPEYLDFVNRLPDLKSVFFKNFGINFPGFTLQSLSSLRSLEKLSIRVCHLSNESFELLGHHSKIKSLILTGRTLGDKEMEVR